MKQTYDINNRTQTKSASANEAAAPPVRPGRAFGPGLWPKAGVIALLLGTGLLTAMGQTNQPQYQFIAIPVPVPSEALGINDSGLVTGAYVNPATGGWTSFVLKHGNLTTGIEIPGATDTILGPRQHLGLWRAGTMATKPISDPCSVTFPAEPMLRCRRFQVCPSTKTTASTTLAMASASLTPAVISIPAATASA